jgi:hypothetical protein
MKKDTNTNALFEKLYECGSEAGMKPIGFFLDGQSLTVNGSKDGMNYTPEVHLKLTLKNSGVVEIEAPQENGNNK